MKKLDNFIQSLNSNQKIIFSIVVPVIIFIIVYPIASSAGTFYGFGFDEVYGGPFNFGRTWYIWVMAIGLITYIEMKIFSDSNK